MFYQVQQLANSFINGSFFSRCFSKFIILEIYIFVVFTIGIFSFIYFLFCRSQFIEYQTNFPCKHEFSWGRLHYLLCCNSSFTVSILLAFLIALLNASTNLSSNLFDLGGRLEMLSVQLNGFCKKFQNLSKKIEYRCRTR